MKILLCSNSFFFLWEKPRLIWKGSHGFLISFQYLNIPSGNSIGQSPFVETESTLARLSETRYFTGYLMAHGIVGRAEIIGFRIILGHLLKALLKNWAVKEAAAPDTIRELPVELGSLIHASLVQYTPASGYQNTPPLSLLISIPIQVSLKVHLYGRIQLTPKSSDARNI